MKDCWFDNWLTDGYVIVGEGWLFARLPATICPLYWLLEIARWKISCFVHQELIFCSYKGNPSVMVLFPVVLHAFVALSTTPSLRYPSAPSPHDGFFFLVALHLVLCHSILLVVAFLRPDFSHCLATCVSYIWCWAIHLSGVSRISRFRALPYTDG